MFGDNPDRLVSIVEDASTLSDVANRHKCTHNCVKYATKGRDGRVLPGAECRFGYGDVGKPILPRGCVTNGKIRAYSDGSVGRNDVLIASEGSHDQRPAAGQKAEILRAAEAGRQGASQGASSVSESHDDEFVVKVRRGSTHINPYNWVIQRCTRSNMDIKVILGDRDGRGLVYYNCSRTARSLHVR